MGRTHEHTPKGFGDDRQITPLRDNDLLTNIAAALTIAD